MNGFVCHIIDHETFGYSSGIRVLGVSELDSQSHVSTMLYEMARVYPHLSTFLAGNSMGGLTLMTYLIRNPQLNIAGVIFLAPFWYLPPTVDNLEVKLFLSPLLDPFIGEIVVNNHISISSLTKDFRFV